MSFMVVVILIRALVECIDVVLEVAIPEVCWITSCNQRGLSACNILNVIHRHDQLQN